MQKQACPQIGGDYAENLIRRKARQLVGKYGLAESDREDLEQDLRLDLFRRIGKFDPLKGKITTFVARIVDRRIANIIEFRRAEMRDYRVWGGSLNDPFPFEDDEDAQLGDAIDAEALLRQRDLKPDPQLDLAGLSADLAAAFASLTADQRTICELLRGHTVLEISEICKISRGAVYGQIEKIRAAFEAASLRDYIPSRSDRSARGPVGNN